MIDACNSCYDCKVLFQSLASDGRTTPNSKPFSPLFSLNDVNIDSEGDAQATQKGTWGVLIWKCFTGLSFFFFFFLRVSLVVSLWGSDGFFASHRDREIKVSLCLNQAARKTNPPVTFTFYITATFTGYKFLFDTISASFANFDLFSFFFLPFSLNALQIWWCHRRHFFLKLWRSTTFLTSLGKHTHTHKHTLTTRLLALFSIAFFNLCFWRQNANYKC